MSTNATTGSAHGNDASVVGKNAYQQALERLGGNVPSVAFVFSSVTYDQDAMLRGIAEISGNTPVVGCSTAGEITTAGPLDEPSVAVMLISSDSIKFHSGIGVGVKENEVAAGKTVADQVITRAGGKDNVKGFIMLSDGLAGNGAGILRGILSELGEHFPLVGGSAGDDFLFKETYQYLGNKVYTNSVVGVGISGNLHHGIGVKHGWGMLSLPAKVTKSSGSKIFEINHKPAIELYRDYFKDQINNIGGKTLGEFTLLYPLGIKSLHNEEFLLRAPLFVDEKDGSIACGAETPEGSDIRIMMGTRESAIAMAQKAAEEAKDALNGATPKAIFIFNCIARKKLFGTRTPEEITAIQEVLGKEIPLIGFYTYGEQAPINGQVKNVMQCNTVFHNETVVIYVLAD